MNSKFALVVIAAAGMMLGCQNNNGKDATAAAHNHEEVCDVPGQGAAVAKSDSVKKPVAVYGGEQKLTNDQAVPIGKVLASPEQYKDKYVRLTGKVNAVCAKKGCWVRVVPDQQASAAAKKGATTQPMKDVFIKFKDPPAGRLIPMEANGKNAVVEGTLKVGQMSEAAARHFAEDGGASQEEINKIVGPQPQLVLSGPVVAINSGDREGLRESWRVDAIASEQVC
jgi:hypothetical protein